MKSRLIVILLIAIALTVFNAGCGEDELSVQEILAKTMEATDESNSSVFEMELHQKMDIVGLDSMIMETTATGKMVEEPLATAIEMQIDMADMQMDMTMYMVDNIGYYYMSIPDVGWDMSIPDVGWVKIDLTENGILEQQYQDLFEYQDPFEYYYMLQEIGTEKVDMERVGDYYLLTYEEDTGALAELMKEELLEQMSTELFDDPEMTDAFEDVAFSDLHYSIKIDSNTFLPAENIIAFTITMEIMDETMYIEQDVIIKYLEYDTFDTITVPDEAITEAVPVDNYSEQLEVDADYYIDYENGTIPIGDLPVGARVVEPGWEWEYRLGVNYSDIDRDGDPTPPGEVKTVTWIIVAHDHYEGLKPHVTLLTEDLIGHFVFDDSSDRDHLFAKEGYNHWGQSGTGNASHGLRPWLNSTGIHEGEGFHRAFSESFKSVVLTTNVSNKEWESGSVYSTQDKVFIPSTTELGDAEEYSYTIGDVYTFFSDEGEEERIAMIVGDGWNEIVEKSWEKYFIEEWGIYGNNCFYWTRSPSSGFGSFVGSVTTLGTFDGFGTSFSLSGVRPVLNLKADTLVSEIRD